MSLRKMCPPILTTSELFSTCHLHQHWLQENPQTGHDSFNKSAQYRNRVQTCSRGRRNDRERKRTIWKVGNDTVCIWNRPTYLPYRIHQAQDTDGKESGGLQLHGRGTGIDTHEPKYELICSIRFEESTVYGAKHRTYWQQDFTILGSTWKMCAKWGTLENAADIVCWLKTPAELGGKERYRNMILFHNRFLPLLQECPKNELKEIADTLKATKELMLKVNSLRQQAGLSAIEN